MDELEVTGADDVVDETSQADDSSAQNDVTPTDDGAGGPSKAEQEAAALLAEENDEPEIDPATGEKVVAEAFKPNVKFKVLDKEMEIPKDFQALMKDKDSEKLVREIFEKAEGLPIVKQKLETVRGENLNLSKRVGQYDQTVSNLQSIYQKAMTTGNLHKLDDWFKVFDMPVDVVIKYALEKAKFAELPPEQKQMIMSQLDAERNAESQQRQNVELQQNYQKMTAETKTLQFESQMQNPEYKSMAELYDGRVGKPGAFKDEVRRVGQLAWYTEKVDLTPQQAIDRVIENYGLKALAGNGTKTVQTPAVGAPGQQATVAGKKTASTIPNFSGTGKSPVTTGKVKNLDDLKKLRDQAWSQSS